MPVVLITAPYMIPYLDRFKPVFDHFHIDLICPQVAERMEEEDLLAYAGQFDAAICGDDRYSAAVLKACTPRLKVISKWGTGIDSIDQEACQKFGVSLKNTTNAFTLPVADSVLGYILAFARQQPWMDKQMKSGIWEKIPGRSLSEMTLGVVGIGNIGKAVIRRAKQFGMTLLGNDILPIAPDFLIENNLKSVTLEDIAKNSDVISLNCDLNPTSYHLIHSKVIDLMKSNAILINTARGPIIKEVDLVQALKAGKIAGAALDVFEFEPLPMDSPLRTMDNVMLAPHNSNSSPAAWERVHWNTIRNLLIGLDINPTDLTLWMNDQEVN